MRLKRDLFLVFGIFLIILINFTSAIPYILFVNPTPVDGYRTTSSGSFEINSTMTNVSSLTELIWNWDSVNYSLYDEYLVLMYNFENNSLIGENDALVVDVSRGGNNGSVINGEYIISGKYGGGYNFSNEEGIIIPNSEEFQTNYYTVSLWIKTKKKNIINFSEGSEHTCYVDDSYSGYCVGDNSYGQLGDGTLVNKNLPVKIQGYQFKQVIANMYSSCGLQLNGSVLCWGENGYGQLGIGNTTDIFRPINISGNYNFSKLVKSHQRACGYLTNGTLMCWGDGNHGEYGDNVSGNRNVPRIIAPGYNFSKITIGEDHMCGMYSNGSVLCWGGNYENQLGDNTSDNRNNPGPVYGNFTFKDIGAGEDQSCGVLTNGSLMCWGENQESQLGNEFVRTNGVIPIFVFTPYLFDKIIIGKHIQYANLTNGSYTAWGWHLSPSSYGDGTYYTGYYPKIVDWNIEFEKVETNLWNSPYSCGMFNYSLYCWGNSFAGENGLGYTNYFTEIPVKLNLGEEFEDFDYEIYTSSNYNLCILKNKEAYCMGYNYYGQLGNGSRLLTMTPVKVSGNHSFSSLALGASHICGLLINGSALCWGYNLYGQLGEGNLTEEIDNPFFVAGNYNFSSLYSGANHVCGLLYNGSALCWGYNLYGQLGIGNTTSMSTPQMIQNYSFNSLSLGTPHSCGILTNGSAVCWGRNLQGQLGNGSIGGYVTLPVFVVGNHNFSTLLTGTASNCGILTNGTTLCWGYNNYGQLGDNSTVNKATPTPIFGNYNFSEIFYSSYVGFGRLSNGSVYAWGDNSDGELGDGTLVNSLIPKVITENFTFSNIFTRGYTSCGEKDNKYYCWGGNSYSQLGNTLPFPNKPINFYYGELISQSQNSFKLGLTLNNSLRTIFYRNNFDYQLNENEYSNIILVSNNTNVNLYVNGNLIFNEEYDIIYRPVLDNLTIGKNTLAEIDEVRVYNRSLSASEVNQLYRTNLKKINQTSWEFYATESLNSGDKTYSYSLFALEGGTSFKVLRNIIKYSLSSEEEYPYSRLNILIQSQNSLKKGYSTNVIEKSKIEIPVEDSSDKIIIEIKDINPDTDKVIVSIENTEYEIALNESSKIDTNNDGFYDIEILNKKNYGTTSNLEFKSIHEEIPAEEQEEVIEEVEEEVINEEENIVEKKNNWKYFVIIGGIILGVLIILLVYNKIKKDKRHKQFGY